MSVLSPARLPLPPLRLAPLLLALLAPAGGALPDITPVPLAPGADEVVLRHGVHIPPLPPEGIEAGLQVLKRAPRLQPRMMVAFGGCSGSSETMKVAKELLNLHQPAGVPPDCHEELMKCRNNAFCELRGSDEVSPPSAMQSAAISYAAFFNRSAVFKATMSEIVRPTGAAQTMAHALAEMETTAFFMARNNTLDELLCEINDFCEVRPVGYPVRNGTYDGSACTHSLRTTRHLPKDEKPQAYFFTARLKESIDAQEKQLARDLATLRRLGWPHAALHCMEDLLAYQDSSADDAALETSVNAWTAVLSGWGVIPDEAIIRRFLAPGRGSYSATPQQQQIANYAEVARELRRLGPKYSRYLT